MNGRTGRLSAVSVVMIPLRFGEGGKAPGPMVGHGRWGTPRRNARQGSETTNIPLQAHAKPHGDRACTAQPMDNGIWVTGWAACFPRVDPTRRQRQHPHQHNSVIPGVRGRV